MGLLDDAIREHLDLKRRSGADPSDVERAEREALGPVRRDPFEGGDELAAEAAPAVGHDHDDAVFDDEYYEDEEYEDEVGDEEESDETLAEDEPPLRPDESRAAEVPDPTRMMSSNEAAIKEPAVNPPLEPSVPAPQSDGVTEEPPVSTSDHPIAGEETVEYDMDEALEAEEVREQPPVESPVREDEPHEPPPAEPDKPAGEDVLEETPEFLQDTPDHDRLWFEQRPPKDFDFDG